PPSRRPGNAGLGLNAVNRPHSPPKAQVAPQPQHQQQQRLLAIARPLPKTPEERLLATRNLLADLYVETIHQSPPDWAPFANKLHGLIHGLHEPLISAALIRATALADALKFLLPKIPPTLQVDIHIALARWRRGIYSPAPDKQYVTASLASGGRRESRGGPLAFVRSAE